MGNQPPCCKEERSTTRSVHRDLFVACHGAPSIDRNEEASTSCTVGAVKPMKIPQYHSASSREQGHLLALSWSRDWSLVVRRCASHPREAYASNDLGRTALHLAMFAGAPPLDVVLALLAANKHAAVVKDRTGSTPLHYACRFGGGNRPGGSGGDEASVIGILCHTAIDVERSVAAYADAAAAAAAAEDPSSWASLSSSPLHLHGSVVVASAMNGGVGTMTLEELGMTRTESPLYLACKRNASFETIRAILDAAALQAAGMGGAGVASSLSSRGGHRTDCEEGISSWIAPQTGAEPWYYRHPKIDCRERSTSCAKKSDGLSREHVMLWPLHAVMDRLSQFEDEAIPLDRLRSCSTDGTEAFEQGDLDEGDYEDSDVPTVLDLWRKILLLLETGQSRCRNGGSGRLQQKLRYPAHAAASLAVPLPALVELTLALHPAAALERDELGMVPLHHAILALTCSKSDPFNPSNRRDGIAVIEALLAASPHAASMLVPVLSGGGNRRNIPAVSLSGSRGELTPLALALSRGLDNWAALGPIVHAAPDSLHARDADTGLFPFMLAASQDAELDTVYRLLRACPQNVATDWR